MTVNRELGGAETFDLVHVFASNNQAFTNPQFIEHKVTPLPEGIGSQIVDVDISKLKQDRRFIKIILTKNQGGPWILIGEVSFER